MAKSEKRSAQERSAVRHGKLRRSTSARNLFRGVLTAALVVAMSGVSVAAYAVWDLTARVKPTVELATEVEVAPGASIGAIDGPITIFLAGTDSREGQAIDDGERGELNDVNLLLHVSEDHQNVTVISFPRDMMIPIPSCPGPNGEPNYYSAMSEQQINTTLNYGGLPCTVATIEKLTGLEIPYAGLISFNGVIEMSNAIGGVEVCLSQPIEDPKTELSLPAGEISLSGLQALQFLRTRYGVGDGGDKSRISNQQIYMSSLVRKIKSAETLSNPLKVYSLAKATVDNVTLSSSLNSVPVLQAIAAALKDVELDRINFIQYPTFRHPYQEGRLTPDRVSAKTMLDLVAAGSAVSVSSTGTAVVAVDEAGNPITPTPTPAATTPTDGSTTDPSATPTPTETATALPDNVTGQSAATKTCSQGRTVF